MVYRWGNWSSKKFETWLQVTQLGTWGACTWTLKSDLESTDAPDKRNSSDSVGQDSVWQVRESWDLRAQEVSLNCGTSVAPTMSLDVQSQHRWLGDKVLLPQSTGWTPLQGSKVPRQPYQGGARQSVTCWSASAMRWGPSPTPWTGLRQPPETALGAPEALRSPELVTQAPNTLSLIGYYSSFMKPSRLLPSSLGKTLAASFCNYISLVFVMAQKWNLCVAGPRCQLFLLFKT